MNKNGLNELKTNRLSVIAAAVIILMLASSALADDPASYAASAKSFFTQFIVAGGFIVWCILIPMSVATVYLVFDLSVSLRRKKLLPHHAAADIESMARQGGEMHLAEMLIGRPDIVSRVIVRIVTKSQQLQTDKKYIDHLAAEALNEQAVTHLRKIEWCNILGNVAPMVGLFGTVFGMIKAFNVLGISAAQPRPDLLAAAISEALVTTFWGLLIAIPALAMHGVFRSRVEAIISEAAIEVETLLHQIILPSNRKAKSQKTAEPGKISRTVPAARIQKITTRKN